jgi:hypothetical protein
MVPALSESSDLTVVKGKEAKNRDLKEEYLLRPL